MKRASILLVTIAFAAPAFAAPALAADERTAELERKVEILAREIEQLRLGAAADTTRAVSRFGFAPAASKVYGAPAGVSIGGYGEALYENFDDAREDGKPSGALDRVDLLRQVLYVGYKFNDELLLNTELEFEHGGVLDEAEVAVDTTTGAGGAELSGEATIEFAYLDWARRREIGLRAGKLLVPLGLVNEMHEPPVFIGARRPEVETRIIPSTWSALGAGIFGELPFGLGYRAYLMEGLDARHFAADAGVRGGRQHGAQSLATRAAFTARLDYSGLPGVLAGAAIFTGNAWQVEQPAGGGLEPVVTLVEAHARLEWRGIEARALYAGGQLRDASRLSDALGLAGKERIGREFFGGYVEAAYDVMPLAYPGTRFAFLPCLRYEESDTQRNVRAPGIDDPANHRTTLTVGAAFKPHPSVVVKADRQRRENDADTGTSQWNLAVGYLF